MSTWHPESHSTPDSFHPDTDFPDTGGGDDGFRAPFAPGTAPVFGGSGATTGGLVLDGWDDDAEQAEIERVRSAAQELRKEEAEKEIHEPGRGSTTLPHQSDYSIVDEPETPVNTWHFDDESTSKPKVSRRALLLGGLGGALLAGGGAYELSKNGGKRAPHAAATIHTSRTVPPGWSQDEVWRTEATVASNVAVGDDTVAFMNAAGSMVIFSGTGKLLTLSPNLGLGQSVSAAVTSVAGQPCVVAAGSGKVVVWPTTGLKATDPGTTYAIPQNATASWAAGALLLTSKTQTWLPNGKGAFTPFTVPSGWTPMGAHPDGTVTVAHGTGAWRRIPAGGGGVTVNPAPVAGASGTMSAAWESNGVIVAWAQTSNDSERLVVFYDAVTGRALASTKAPAGAVNLGLPLAVNRERTLASAGPVLANFSSGTAVVVSGWQTLSLDRMGMYGQAGGGSDAQRLSWSGSGSTHPMDSTVAVPWGSLKNGMGVIVDVDSTNAQYVTAIRPS